jgi:hypothetical protein
MIALDHPRLRGRGFQITPQTDQIVPGSRFVMVEGSTYVVALRTRRGPVLTIRRFPTLAGAVALLSRS